MRRVQDPYIAYIDHSLGHHRDPILTPFDPKMGPFEDPKRGQFSPFGGPEVPKRFKTALPGLMQRTS